MDSSCKELDSEAGLGGIVQPLLSMLEASFLMYVVRRVQSPRREIIETWRRVTVGMTLMMSAVQPGFSGSTSSENKTLYNFAAVAPPEKCRFHGA